MDLDVKKQTSNLLTLKILSLSEQTQWRFLFRFQDPSHWATTEVLIVAQRWKCKKILTETWQGYLKVSRISSYQSSLFVARALSKENLATVDMTLTIRPTLYTQTSSVIFWIISRRYLVKWRIQVNTKVTVDALGQVVQGPLASESPVLAEPLSETQTAVVALAIFNQACPLGKQPPKIHWISLLFSTPWIQ